MGTRSPGEVATQASAEQNEQFRALAAAQLPRLYGLARRLVGDDAEDAVQDCLLKAYRGYGRLGDQMAGPGWLTSILVNCCRDRGRARARHPAEVDLDSLDEFSLYRKIAGKCIGCCAPAAGTSTPFATSATRITARASPTETT